MLLCGLVSEFMISYFVATSRHWLVAHADALAYNCLPSGLSLTPAHGTAGTGFCLISLWCQLEIKIAFSAAHKSEVGSEARR